jgi:hypothetical protein
MRNQAAARCASIGNKQGADFATNTPHDLHELFERQKAEEQKCVRGRYGALPEEA